MIKKAFTLIELIVTITIVAILALGINNISLTKISEAQKVGIFLNKIRSNIETAINNSLTGKAINGMNVPKYWEITINNSSNGTGYGTGNILIKFGSGIFQTNTGLTIKSQKFYSIGDIKCLELNGNSTTATSINSGTINIKDGNIINIDGCATNKKLLKFTIKYKNYKKELTINSLNNVINTK